MTMIMVIARIKHLILILGISLAATATAEDNTTIRAGFGAGHSDKSAIYSVGYEERNVRDVLMYKLDLGAWTSGTRGKSSPFVSGLVGVRLGSVADFYAQGLVGIAIVGNTDELLGSNFQFTEEAAVGYKSVSVGYKHVSSANLGDPNLGRDYWFCELKFPLTF